MTYLCTFTFCKWDHTCHMNADAAHAHCTHISVNLTSLCCWWSWQILRKLTSLHFKSHNLTWEIPKTPEICGLSAANRFCSWQTSSCKVLSWLQIVLSCQKLYTTVHFTVRSCPYEILKYCTVGFLPSDRQSERESKLGWAWMNNRRSIMDDKLTKFFLSVSPSVSFYSSSFCFLSHFLLFSSMLHSLCDTMSLLWGTCSPLSLLAAWKRAALLYGLLKSPGDVLSSPHFSEKSD